jgi:hypothetical protein
VKTILNDADFNEKHHAGTAMLKVLRRLDLIRDATYYLTDNRYFISLWKAHVVKKQTARGT